MESWESLLGVGPAPCVLIVDDEISMRELISRWLQDTGCDLASAASAEIALEVVRARGAAVALCDMRMPGHGGLWLAEQLRQSFPETAVIMATAVQEVGPAVASLRQGVVDYLTKPFGRDRLREAVQRGLDWHRSAVDARRWREALERESRAQQRRLAEAIAAVRVDSDEAVDALLEMLTLDDPDAYAHAYRVAALGRSLARALGMDDRVADPVERAALLHDVGKLAMPEAVLLKPAPLTNEELSLVRTHPRVAYELLCEIPYLAEAAAIVHGSQERFDGLGYPSGLRGEEIALGARIVSLADAFDTMTRSRVFRDALGLDEALLEIERCSGTQFDPAIVAVCRHILAESPAHP